VKRGENEKCDDMECDMMWWAVKRAGVLLLRKAAALASGLGRDA
jgi:hypothetical protein